MTLFPAAPRLIDNVNPGSHNQLPMLNPYELKLSALSSLDWWLGILVIKITEFSWKGPNG